MIELKLATKPLAMSSCLRSDHQPEIALPVLPLYSHNTFYSVGSFFQVSHIFLEMTKRIANKDFSGLGLCKICGTLILLDLQRIQEISERDFVPIYWDFIGAVVVVITCPPQCCFIVVSNPSFFPESGYGSLAERLSSGEPFLIHLFGSNMKKCRLKT